MDPDQTALLGFIVLASLIKLAIYSTHFLLQNPNLLDKNLHNIPKKKLSFRSVTNCVLRLIHSVKFNAEIPFSNVLTPQAEEKHHPGHGSSKFVSNPIQ